LATDPRRSQQAADAAGAVELDRVAMQFDTPSGVVRALDGVSLSVRPRAFVSLLGPSGCGKSTLLRLVADVLAPTGGSIRVAGTTPEAARKRRAFGFVFQDATLLAWRSALQNALLPLEIAGGTRDARARAMRLLNLVGLAGFENAYPWQLSGGMRQRVSIARAFATNAAILLCDEPFSALDESTAGRLRAEFVRLVKENGKTAVFITHSISEALEIGDRIVVLKRPARIALDLPLTSAVTDAERQTMRGQIQTVLAA
jgi:NitT/TauT family transport system ATP-binding protein